jgi:hypothetical protein
MQNIVMWKYSNKIKAGIQKFMSWLERTGIKNVLEEASEWILVVVLILVILLLPAVIVYGISILFGATYNMAVLFAGLTFIFMLLSIGNS